MKERARAPWQRDLAEELSAIFESERREARQCDNSLLNRLSIWVEKKLGGKDLEKWLLFAKKTEALASASLFFALWGRERLAKGEAIDRDKWNELIRLRALTTEQSSGKKGVWGKFVNQIDAVNSVLAGQKQPSQEEFLSLLGASVEVLSDFFCWYRSLVFPDELQINPLSLAMNQFCGLWQGVLQRKITGLLGESVWQKGKEIIAELEVSPRSKKLKFN